MISHRPAFETRPRRAAFTLIELLAVLVVVGILMAVAIPAVTGIGKGSSLQAATSNVRGTIMFARQSAVAKRSTVYVVFPDDQPTLFSTPEEAALALRGYAVFEVTNSVTGAGQYLTDWKLLPNGIIFDDRVIVGSHPSGSNVFAPGNSATLPFPTVTSSTHNLNVLAILPSGRLSGGVGTGHIYLREGQSMPLGSTPSVTPVGQTLFHLDVNPFTGSVNVLDRTP